MARKYQTGETVKVTGITGETSCKFSFSTNTEEVNTKDDTDTGWNCPEATTRSWSCSVEFYGTTLNIPTGEVTFASTLGGGAAIVTASEVNAQVGSVASGSLTYTGNGEFTAA